MTVSIRQSYSIANQTELLWIQNTTASTTDQDFAVDNDIDDDDKDIQIPVNRQAADPRKGSYKEDLRFIFYN